MRPGPSSRDDGSERESGEGRLDLLGVDRALVLLVVGEAEVEHVEGIEQDHEDVIEPMVLAEALGEFHQPLGHEVQIDAKVTYRVAYGLFRLH